ERGEADGGGAKWQVKTAEAAEETYAADHNGTYTATVSDLTALEPTLGDTGVGATLSIASATGTTGYSLVSTAGTTGEKFTLTNSSGTVTRTCSNGSGGGNPGGCTGGKW